MVRDAFLRDADFSAKRVDRMAYVVRKRQLIVRSETQQASLSERRELWFMILAERLLRAKYWSCVALTNQEMEQRLNTCSAAQLQALMSRKAQCSVAMAKALWDALNKWEDDEFMPVINHPEFPEA